MSRMDHLRKYDACWPNDRFPIWKRTLGEAPAKGRFWPTPAVRLARAPKAGIDPKLPLRKVAANVGYRTAKRPSDYRDQLGS
jgi:hypothetical protein